MKNILLLFCLIFFAGLYKAKAQFIYPNDVCSGAMPLPVSNTGLLSDSVFQRITYADPANSTIPNCAGVTNGTRHDLWYSFIASDTSIAVVLEHVYGSGLYYQLFTGNCESLISLQCSPDGATFPNLSGLVIGQKYYLRIYYHSVLPLDKEASNYNLSLLAMPVNDECTGAVLLPVNAPGAPAYTSLHFSNAQATASTTASCASNAGWVGIKDVWYKFVATDTRHTIYAGTTAQVYVYKGVLGSLTGIGTKTISYEGYVPLSELTIGSTYYIRVGSKDIVPIKLGIFQGQPANDECINADTVLVSSSFKCENNFSVYKTGATTSTMPLAQEIKNDVWYIFKATVPDITVTSTGDNASSAQLSLFSGSCGSLTSLINKASGTFTYSGLVPGNYYYLQAGRSNIYDGEKTNYICIAPKISNDECSGAIALQVNPYNIFRKNLSSNLDATQSMAGCQTGSAIADVWYRFTATDTACLITLDAEKTSNPYFEVFAGNCGALTSIYCSSGNSIPSGFTEKTEKVSGLITGNNYYVRYYSPNAGKGIFTIDVNSLPANDDCMGATTLVPQQGLGYEPMFNNGILHASTSLPACAPATITNDIWYKFTATQSSMAIISNCETSATLGYELYSGPCATLTSIACVQQGTALHKAQTFTNLLPGNSYYIRQYGNFAKNRITIIDRPINDEMAGAIKLTVTPNNVQPMPSYYLHGASKQFGKVCSNAPYTIHHDVWFYFIATEASHTVSTNAFNSYWAEQIAGYTYRLEAFSGFGADSLSLVTKAIGCAASSLTVNALTAGDTVYVRVANTAAEGNTSIFSLKVTGTQNIDEPTGALILDKLNTFQYSLSTAGATQSLPASGCTMVDFPDDDIWLKFTSSASIKRIVAANETRDITLQLFSGTSGNLTAITCSNEIMVLPSNLVHGTVYYLRVYSKVNALAASFNIGLYGEDDMLANSLISSANLGANLVINPRCESDQKYLLPKNDKGAQVTGTKLAEGWWSANYATADVWHADYPLNEWGNVPGSSNSNIQVPRSGKGMLGILNEYGQSWNEYITGKLTQPLMAGKTYLVSLYVLSKKGTGKGIFNIGAYLSNDSIIGGSTGPLEITPHVANASQITSEHEWVNICGLFYADKPYSFITIGNFGNQTIYGSSLNSYVFIDDVVVAELTNQVLPLNLLNFIGRTNAQQQTELNWQTADELNTKNFEVEWHNDAGTFAPIGNVAAKTGAYNSYDFLHRNPSEGNNYYRLKMFDIDGNFTYSSILKTVVKSNNDRINVYPNPVSSSVNISINSDKEEMVFFRLVNSNGSTVATKSILLKKGSNAFTWDVKQLAAGSYFITSTNKKFKVVKLLKQ